MVGDLTRSQAHPGVLNTLFFASSRKTAHSCRVYVRTGPAGFFESRTATRLSARATSTQAPLLTLLRALRHFSFDGSIADIFLLGLTYVGFCQTVGEIHMTLAHNPSPRAISRPDSQPKTTLLSNQAIYGAEEMQKPLLRDYLPWVQTGSPVDLAVQERKIPSRRAQCTRHARAVIELKPNHRRESDECGK